MIMSNENNNASRDEQELVGGKNGFNSLEAYYIWFQPKNRVKSG